MAKNKGQGTEDRKIGFLTLRWVLQRGIFLILFSIFCFLSSHTSGYAQEAWQEIKSEHFFVYFTGDGQFARDVSRQSEIYYKRIAAELGYQRYSGFWTWDNRVKIYIYRDRASFLASTKQPQWSEGLANYTDRQIISYAWSEGFLDSLLPHEMAHLIFRDYVGFKGEVPLWLDEGVAQWMEPRKRENVQYAIQRLFAQGKLLSLSRLMTLDVRNREDQDLVNVFYIQAASLVGFLIKEYSAARFTSFCRQLRDGKSIEDSLTFAYSVSVRSLDELESKWRQYITEEIVHEKTK